MIYQLNGKFGPFTLASDNEKLILASVYKIAPDNSVYITNPVIIDNRLDYIQYELRIQQIFIEEGGVAKFVDDNILDIHTVIEKFICGYEKDRKEYETLCADIRQDPTIPIVEKNDAVIMIREAYQNNDALFDRINKIKSQITHRIKELTASNTQQNQNQQAVLPVPAQIVQPQVEPENEAE